MPAAAQHTGCSCCEHAAASKVSMCVLCSARTAGQLYDDWHVLCIFCLLIHLC
jgi:hypothetical protein